MFGKHEISPQLRRRLNVAVGLAAVALGLLVARLWVLQVLHGEEMAALSENNRIRLRRVQATRGRVTDRAGRVLVDSRASFDAVIVPEDARDLELTVENLAQFLGQGAAETKRILEQAAGRPPFQEVLVKRDLNWDEVVALETHQLDLPGVSLRVTPSRTYPYGELLAHVLGYVGEVNQDEVKRDPRYRAGDVVGRAGIEREWEDDLRGVNGGQQIEVDALGRELRVLQEAETTPGHTLALAIDLDLQQATEQALGDNAGAIVALDPRTGEVLAIASHPAFDPNHFTRGIRGDEWRELLDHPRRPLTDRAIQGQYPPGSTFKIVMATAALEEGVINPFTHIHCSGQMHYGQRDFRCWRKGGHGTVDLHNALVQSCDVFFYQVGQRLGIDTIAEYARSFGLGVTTGIKLEHEKSGTMPDSAWKRKRFKQPWFAGETLSVAIGQGYVTATPLQMAQAVATLATGIRYRPHLVKSILAPDDSVVQTFEPEELGRVPARPFVLEQVREGVRDVVNAPNGTGKKAALKDVTVAGKTGTAQVVTIGKERKKAQQMPWNERDHAWFIAYAPFEEPEIAVATLVEHADGGGGAVAAPIAHTVLQAYFDLQSKKEPARYAQN